MIEALYRLKEKKMKTVILAAGEGKRMNNLTPKPLTKILGLTLIERVILTAKECGLKDFLIVLGYNGEKIKRYLLNKKTLKDLNLSFIFNQDWEKGNGSSLLSVKEILKEKFLLLMADHIFPSKILKRLLEDEGEEPKMVVIKKYLIGLEQETKVKIEAGLVKDLRKDLEEFDGVDAGIFLLTPKIFQIPSSQEGKEEISLSLILSEFIQKERLKPLIVDDSYVINVNTKAQQKNGAKVLLNSQIKKDDGIIARFLNRRISRQITKIVATLPVQPNLISLFAFGIALLSGISFLFSSLLGGILAQISSILDGVDGEIARIKFQKTAFGSYFDPILDRYGDSFILFSIGLSLYLKNNNPLIWFVTFLAIIGSFMSMATQDRFFVVKGKKYPLQKEGWLYYIPNSRDFRLFLIMLGGLANQLFLTLVLLAIITNLKILLRTIFVNKALTKE